MHPGLEGEEGCARLQANGDRISTGGAVSESSSAGPRQTWKPASCLAPIPNAIPSLISNELTRLA